MTNKGIFTTVDTRCWSREDALILSFTQSRPTITTDVLDAIIRAVDAAERDYATLAITSGDQFAFGANLNSAFDAAAEGRPELLDSALDSYQRVMLRLRHASIPTVAAVRGVAVSGGCELLMHCTRVVAHDRSHIGLAEASVGVVPGGGGLKEFALRAGASAACAQSITRAFEVIATSTISKSASDAQGLGYLTPLDRVGAADPLAEAIALGLELHNAGYVPPPRNPSFPVMGPQLLLQLRDAQMALLEGGKLTKHQFDVNMHIGMVLCGGDAAGDVRTEAEMLVLERRHFLAIFQSPLTRARLAHLRNTGTRLAN